MGQLMKKRTDLDRYSHLVEEVCATCDDDCPGQVRRIPVQWRLPLAAHGMLHARMAVGSATASSAGMQWSLYSRTPRPCYESASRVALSVLFLTAKSASPSQMIGHR
mmetsp:Transcript_67462/g.161866  ORF Transcript_67462/g.161866 Transcript_67462/m.161866 type:complete len:107 (-) Transcript_67462:1248-1568(-)